MTGAEESQLRVLLTKVRQERPDVFTDLVVDVMVARLGENTVTTLIRSDEDEIPEVAIVVAKGTKPTVELLRMAKEMQGE